MPTIFALAASNARSTSMRSAMPQRSPIASRVSDSTSRSNRARRCLHGFGQVLEPVNPFADNFDAFADGRQHLIRQNRDQRVDEEGQNFVGNGDLGRFPRALQFAHRVAVALGRFNRVAVHDNAKFARTRPQVIHLPRRTGQTSQNGLIERVRLWRRLLQHHGTQIDARSTQRL